MELTTCADMFYLTDDELGVIRNVVMSQSQVERDETLRGIRARQCPGLKGLIDEVVHAEEMIDIEDMRRIAYDQAVDGFYRRVAVYALRQKAVSIVELNKGEI